ncbi:hypothetical protein NQ315_007433 [Exocentrus adspersus]|uniref:Protein hunchback n=1 Tax=Exocentrus adspersus TaxID=1586481 RepID=A0AAV8VIK2_9CUCU|nr:hypothetical protein NQ315_007433 [Exocentrus adspersus]
MDSNRKSEICVLCCNEYSECNFEEIVEETKGIFSILLLHIDTNENRSFMCEYCSIKVKIFYAFKSACIRTEAFITSFLEGNMRNQVDLKELFMRERGHGEPVDALYNKNLCRLCMVAIDAGCVYLDESDSHVNFVKSLMQKYIPEVNVGNTKDPVVCDDCIDLLKNYSAFLDSCAEASIQKTIKSAFQVNGTEEVTDQATAVMENLNELLKHHSVFGFPDKEESNSLIQTESFETRMFDRGQFGYHQPGSNGMEQYYGMYNYQNQALGFNTAPTPDTLHLNSFRSTPSDQPSTSTAVKTPVDQHVYDFDSDSEVKSHNSNLRRRKSQHKPKIRRRKTQSDEAQSQTTPYNCYLCNFKSKHKPSLRRHIMLVHKDPSDPQIKWFRCDLCDYKAKRRDYLKAHMSVHKNHLDMEWLKCDLCDYKTKRKGCLNTHMSVHKD